MCENSKKAAIFILLGQSNAVGHGTPMTEEDKIKSPLKNVFGLSRTYNQSFDIDSLRWSGYTSGNMNLGEEQDDTYSVANCLAKLWQKSIDEGANLPDLYIIHIAVGAQGVMDNFMWNPGRGKILIPGKLKNVNISLYPFTKHIFSLVQDSMKSLGKTPEYLGIHWRGSEQDVTVPIERLRSDLKNIYNTMLSGFYEALGQKVPVILHRIVSEEIHIKMDPTGGETAGMNFVNDLFDELSSENDNITVFDARKAPFYLPDVSGNGLFGKDIVHFTGEANNWVAKEIFSEYNEARK